MAMAVLPILVLFITTMTSTRGSQKIRLRVWEIHFIYGMRYEYSAIWKNSASKCLFVLVHVFLRFLFLFLRHGQPDNQGFSYEWAGAKWLEHASYFSSEIMAMRARGTMLTPPLIKAGGADVIASNVAKFFNACGTACRDSKNPATLPW